MARLALLFVAVSLAACAEETPVAHHSETPSERAADNYLADSPRRSPQAAATQTAVPTPAPTKEEELFAYTQGLCSRGQGTGTTPAGAVCTLVALDYERGVVTPRSIPDAIAAFKRACEDFRLGMACVQLATRYEHASDEHAYFPAAEYPKNLVRAAALYERACELGDEGGCYGHAIALHSGYAGAPDELAAIAILEKICQAEPLAEPSSSLVHANACKDLGDKWTYAKPAKPDLASKYYFRACKLGLDAACDKVKRP